MNSLIIVIPHYNDLDGLKKTLLSVIEDIKIDVIVVDDGSEDKIDESKLNFNRKYFLQILISQLRDWGCVKHWIRICITTQL